MDVQTNKDEWHKDQLLISAISCGVVAAFAIGKDMTYHPLCLETHAKIGCERCRIGIVKYEMKLCPFCGSGISSKLGRPSSIGAGYTMYSCGTCINSCGHCYGVPESITTVIIGNLCCGLEEDII